jgi:hypothetical protein
MPTLNTPLSFDVSTTKNRSGFSGAGKTRWKRSLLSPFHTLGSAHSNTRPIAREGWRKARRPVPLSDRVITLLNDRHQQQEGPTEGWVFPSKRSRSGHIELSGIEHTFRKVARKFEIPDSLKLYCARHTFGTVAMAQTRNRVWSKKSWGTRA